MAPLDRARIRVENADALARPSDVLVLKYAQQPYGLDRAVLGRLRQSLKPSLPAPGENVVLRRPPGVSADALVLLGTPDLTEFGYRDIREFGSRAVHVVAAELPDSRELCLTLHGVGFGLDEREAFRAQVAGVLDAFGGLPRDTRLEAVTFLEWETRRASRMADQLGALEAGSEVGARDVPSSPGSRPDAGGWRKTAGVDSDSRPHAFVAMPFGEAFDDVFHYAIVGSVEKAGLLCERMDRVAFTGDIIEQMKRRIRTSKVVVADLSGGNPNVYLEVGFAWASGVPTVLLCNGDTEPHFDVQGHRHLRYRTIREAEKQLARELDGLVDRNRSRAW